MSQHGMATLKGLPNPEGTPAWIWDFTKMIVSGHTYFETLSRVGTCFVLTTQGSALARATLG
jgi:hypothetical protein